MEWLEKLQAPGLILAGVVIYLQFKIIMKLLGDSDKIVSGLAENNRITARLTSVLADLVCRRNSK